MFKNHSNMPHNQQPEKSMFAVGVNESTWVIQHVSVFRFVYIFLLHCKTMIQ